MIKATYLWLSILILSSITSYASPLEQPKLKIKNLTIDKDINFPLILDKTEVAQSINMYIQKSILNTNYKIKNQKLIKRDEEEYILIDYTIHSNNHNILSLVIGLSYTGEDYSEYTYLFDTKNGKIITMDMLFTKDGLEDIKKILIKKRAFRVDSKIKSLKVTKYKSAKEVLYDKESLEGCKDFSFELYFGIDEANYQIYNFYIVKDSIIFKGTRCGGNDYQGVSDIFKLYILDYGDVEPYLNNYGNSLMGQNK